MDPSREHWGWMMMHGNIIQVVLKLPQRELIFYNYIKDRLSKFKLSNIYTMKFYIAH